MTDDIAFVQSEREPVSQYVNLALFQEQCKFLKDF